MNRKVIRVIKKGADDFDVDDYIKTLNENYEDIREIININESNDYSDEIIELLSGEREHIKKKDNIRVIVK